MLPWSEQARCHEPSRVHATWLGGVREFELARLGGGEVAYIKTLSSDDAQRMFPMVEGLPADTNLFSLHAADGTPIALTDDMGTAIEHALGDELEIAPLH